MEILKLKSKLNCSVIIFLGLTLSIHSATAIILDGYAKYYTPEEIIVNNIIANIFSFLFIMSFLILLIGVYKDCKDKKRNKNFSMIKFLFISFVSCFVVFIISALYADLFVKYIYCFYPYYFTYIGITIFLIPIYLFTKISAKILKLEFLVILSFFMIIFSFLVISGK